MKTATTNTIILATILMSGWTAGFTAAVLYGVYKFGKATD